MPEALHIGYEEGYGPYVKVMADQNDNPLTTPDDDYDKYRFNSKRADLTPLQGVFADQGATGKSVSTALANTHTVTVDGLRYNPITVVYSASSDGWNYPDHWGGYRPGRFSDNIWGNNYRIGAGLSAQGLFVPFNGTPNFITFDIPAAGDKKPWAASQTPQDGQLFFSMNPTGGPLLARPGYDIGVATEDQLIFGDTPRPLLYFTKRDTLAAGETKSYTLPQGTPDDAVCLMQWNTAGASSRFLPSIWIGATRQSVRYEARWKVEDGNLVVENMRPNTVDFLMIVMGRTPHVTDETHPLKTGIDASGKKYFQFNKGGYTILDTRYAYLPIIKSGAVASPPGSTLTIDFPGQSYFPFVIALMDYTLNWNEIYYETSPFGTTWRRERPKSRSRVQNLNYTVDTHDTIQADSFTATVTRSSVIFRWNFSDHVNGVPATSVYMNVHSLNYFIFGIPNFD